MAVVAAPGVKMGGGVLEPWRPLGDLPGGHSPLGRAASLCFVIPSVLGFVVWFFLLSFLSTLYFFCFIKSHMYFEFLWCRLFNGAFSVQSSNFLYYVSK